MYFPKSGNGFVFFFVLRSGPSTHYREGAVLVMASIPVFSPTFAPVVHDFGYSDLAESDRGAVIGSVAAFGSILFCFIFYLLYHHTEESQPVSIEQAAVAQDDQMTVSQAV